MVIQHNLQAMNTNRQLNIVTGTQSEAMEKLSSGYKVNRAADDAAGLAISEKMRRQIRGLTQASLNARDGIQMVQIADGAMAEVHDMLQRGNELAVKAATGTLTPDDRAYIQREIDQLKQEIDAIQEKTTFNELYVLKGVEQGTTGKLNYEGGLPDWAEVDPQSDATGYMKDSFYTQEEYIARDGTVKTADIPHDAARIDFSKLDASNVADLVGGGFYCTCCTCGAHYSVRFTTGTTPYPNVPEESGIHLIYNIGIEGITNGEQLVQAIIRGTEDGNPSPYGDGHYSWFAADPANPGTLVVYDNRSNASRADTVPADFSSWVSWRERDAWQFDTHSGDGGGRFGQGVATEGERPPKRKELILQIGSERGGGNEMKIELPVINTKSVGITDAHVLTQDGAMEAVGMFKYGIAFVSNERSRMGAYQNRLEHTVRNLDNVIENTTAAESQIRDTDMAKQMVLFSNYNILTQAGQSMLAQANQSKQTVLSLLQA